MRGRLLVSMLVAAGFLRADAGLAQAAATAAGATPPARVRQVKEIGRAHV